MLKNTKLGVALLIIGSVLLGYKATEIAIVLQKVTGQNSGLVLSPITIPILLCGTVLFELGIYILVKAKVFKK